MPVSNYRIVVGQTPEDLSAQMTTDDLAPIGQATPFGFVVLQAAGTGVVDPFGQVQDYTLLQASTPEALADLVNAKIADSYQPIGGGVVVWGNVFMQGVGLVSQAVGGD